MFNQTLREWQQQYRARKMRAHEKVCDRRNRFDDEYERLLRETSASSQSGDHGDPRNRKQQQAEHKVTGDNLDIAHVRRQFIEIPLQIRVQR